MNTMFKKLCSIVVGLVYVVSGLLKLMDPVGTGLIIEAYFRFMHLPESALVAKILGVVLGALETAIGFGTVFCMWSRITRWLMIGMQSAFTLLSLALVIWNPQMHCGCFGEAIHLTHWQTFIKNIVLIGMLWGAYFPLWETTKTTMWQYISYIISIILTLSFSIYSLCSLPLIDFTNYKKGTEIISTKDYWNLSSNKKTGKISIPMLGIQDNKVNENIYTGKWVIISIYDMPENIESWIRIKDTYVKMSENGYSVILLVASTKDRFLEFYNRLHDKSVITQDILDKMMNSTCLTDKTTVLTMNRANGGLTIINDGIIVEKTRKTNYTLYL